MDKDDPYQSHHLNTGLKRHLPSVQPKNAQVKSVIKNVKDIEILQKKNK